MPVPTRWFQYGEPTGNSRIYAVICTTYQIGPNERPRGDDLRCGTVGYEALEVMEENEEVNGHIHSDGSVCLSGLSETAEEKLLTTFEAEEVAE